MLESIIEDRSRSLFLVEADLRESAQFVNRILATLGTAVIVTDATGCVTRINRSAATLMGEDSVTDGVGWTLFERLRKEGEPAAGSMLELIGAQRELTLHSRDGEPRDVLFTASDLRDENGELHSVVCVATDLRERKALEVELRHAQKLESVGQLAAGMAHEINTPIQFVGDSLTFLEEAFEDISGLVESYDTLRKGVADSGSAETLAGAADRTRTEIDYEFLAEEVPDALKRAIGGVDRVAKIVRAMKEFAHPGSDEVAPADLNHAIETTLTVAANEFKYVADLTTDFGDLPSVPCHIDDLNQVVLNLIVNAAHSLEDCDRRGAIHISTHVEDSFAVVKVRDNGAGIPESIQDRIFDPFFTTKAVGKGTGQGLALAHAIVVERHGGTLTFDTQKDVGTTFTIRIPLALAERHAA